MVKYANCSRIKWWTYARFYYKKAPCLHTGRLWRYMDRREKGEALRPAPFCQVMSFPDLLSVADSYRFVKWLTNLTKCCFSAILWLGDSKNIRKRLGVEMKYLLFLIALFVFGLDAEIIQHQRHVTVPMEKTQFSIAVSTADTATTDINIEVFRYDLLTAFASSLRSRVLSAQKNAITSQLAHKWVFNYQTIHIELSSFWIGADNIRIYFRHAISKTSSSGFYRDAEYQFKYSTDINQNREQRYTALSSQVAQQFASEYIALFLVD